MSGERGSQPLSCPAGGLKALATWLALSIASMASSIVMSTVVFTLEKPPLAAATNATEATSTFEGNSVIATPS